MKFGKLLFNPLGGKFGNPIKCDINIDFEGHGGSTGDNNIDVGDDKATSLDGDSGGKANLDDIDNNVNNNNDDNNNINNTVDNNNDNDDNTDIVINPGDEIEFDGVKYTVDENKNIIDADGNIFKTADEVKDWLAEQNVVDNSNGNELNIQNIIELVGTNITDEEGNPVEFTNDAEGVRSYIDSVMELRTNEIATATMNRFFDNAPIVKDFIDYLTVNGSPRGFGEIRNLSNVKLDKDNEGQLEAVIRTAAQEFGNSMLSESYIKYLKDSGGLYDEANKQLQAMVARDKEAQEEMRKQAEQSRKEDQERVEAYWRDVSETIKSREIAGYKIPENFVIENNGKKVTVTPEDFWYYLTARDKETGLSEYQRDLENMTDKEVMDNELLDAWLHFTGRSYKDLINMELKKEQVKQLKLASKNNATRSAIKINRKSSKTTDINSIILG